MEELKCKVCGKLASEDSHFYPKQLLCNRHYLQWHIHGKFLDNKLVINDQRQEWTEEEIQIITNGYKNYLSVSELAAQLHRTPGSITSKARSLGLSDLYIKKNNAQFKAVYQDYDWCYEHYINQGMSQQEMANEAGCSVRVIQKWCSEIHKLNKKTFRKLKKLSPVQYQLVIAGTLGDGHISKQDGLYIESHSITEKDYLFWKYNILKDICTQPPTYYDPRTRNFSNGEYFVNAFYRFGTRELDQLIDIRDNLTTLDKISMFNEFMLSIHILDDGSRDALWHICLAGWSEDEINAYIQKCKELGLICIQDADKRYCHFTAYSSKKIDEMILRNIPNDLDIIKKKITENTHIIECKHMKYVIVNQDKIGLSTYLKNKPDQYKIAKQYYEDNQIEYLSLNELMNILKRVS